MAHLQTLNKPNNDDDDDKLAEKEDAFEGLGEIVDNLDNANGRLFCFFSATQFIVSWPRWHQTPCFMDS